MMADIFIILMLTEVWNWEELIVRWLEILKVGLSTPSVSWGDASILENRGNIDDDDDDDGILVIDDEKDDDGDYDEKQLRELGAGRPAPCLAGNQLISHHRSNQDNDDDGVDNEDIHHYRCNRDVDDHHPARCYKSIRIIWTAQV